MAERVEQGREVLAEMAKAGISPVEYLRSLALIVRIEGDASCSDREDAKFLGAIANHVRALEAERDRYWEALAPFQRLRVARMASDDARLNAEHSDEDSYYNTVCPIEGVRMGDLYAARAALQGGQSDGE